MLMAQPRTTPAERPGRPRRRGGPLVGRRLPREAVVADQRRRIVAALPAALLEYGYEGGAIEEMVRRSHVSRRTFYELFDSKDSAIRAARGEALKELREALRGACSPDGAWPEGLATGLAESLRFAAADPARARLLLGDPWPCGPHAAASWQLLLDLLVPSLRRGRLHTHGSSSEMLDDFLLGGIRDVVLRRIEAGCSQELPDLAGPLHDSFLAPFVAAGLSA